MPITRRVKFISYTGESPNFCRNGVLTLEIDGDTVTFGNAPECDFDPFWSPGCSYIFPEDADGEAFEVSCAEFDMPSQNFPDEFAGFFFEVANVLDENGVFNHCGGCR